MSCLLRLSQARQLLKAYRSKKSCKPLIVIAALGCATGAGTLHKCTCAWCGSSTSKFLDRNQLPIPAAMESESRRSLSKCVLLALVTVFSPEASLHSESDSGTVTLPDRSPVAVFVVHEADCQCQWSTSDFMPLLFSTSNPNKLRQHTLAARCA